MTYPEQHPDAPVAQDDGILLWSSVRKSWPSLPRKQRIRLVVAAADCLRALWAQGVDLQQLPLVYMAFAGTGESERALFPPRITPAREQKLQTAGIVECLASWLADTRAVLAPRECVLFLRRFLGQAPLDRGDIHAIARHVDRRSNRLARDRALSLYTQFLRAADHGHGDVHGVWNLNKDLHPRLLLKAAQAAETDPATRRIKAGSTIVVMRATLLGHDVLIKRYELKGWYDRLRYRTRPSKARRSWAAAQTLTALDIPTPPALGYVEVREGKTPVISYALTEYVSGSIPVYRWLKQQARRMTAEQKDEVKSLLPRMLLQLYDHGIYHADTKLPNLLVQHHASPSERRFYWIDLECVMPGAQPTRHRIVRNLVQMNGSVRHWVTEEDRMTVLRHFAQRYPWLLKPKVIEKMRAWTVERLVKEVRRHTPPDGRSQISNFKSQISA